MDTAGAKYYVPIGDESRKKEHNNFDKPRNTPRIMRRIFPLTPTSYKYLELGINVGPTSCVELILGDNRGNQIVLPHATWTTLIEKRADIERLLQSTIGSSLSIQDLVFQLVKMRDRTSVVKLTLYNTCLYMKPSTVLFLFELERCVEHEYLKLCHSTHEVDERFDLFVYSLQSSLFGAERDDAVKILREVCNKTSVIDCELLAYAVDELLRDALRRGDVR